MEKWSTLSSETVVSHRYFSLVRDTCRLPGGIVLDDYYVVQENDVGVVFALTAERSVLLVEQYKHGVDDICLELPGGLFESGAAGPLEEARREFNEETGYDAAEYWYVGRIMNNPTRLNNYIYVYAAVDAFPAGPQRLDRTEAIQVRQVPVDELFELIRSGRVSASTSVAAAFLAWDYLKARGLAPG